MSTFVLVHGAWHGAWCWYKVVAELERGGHDVVAVDLPGHGTHPAPVDRMTLDGYADHVAGVLARQPEPVVLVGHSMGGQVISHAAELQPDKVARLVYLTAFLVPDGGTLLEAAAGDPQGPVQTSVQTVDDGPLMTVRQEALESLFYGCSSDEDVALARLCLVPESGLVMQAPVRTTPERWGRIPRTYIECTRDGAIAIEVQRAMVARLPCESVLTLDTDHSPFFSRPIELAGQLASLASS